MRTKIILVALSFTVGVSFTGCKKSSPVLSVESISDQGIYVGEGMSGLESPKEKQDRWTKTVNGLNQGWEYIRLGNSYDTAGKYQEAVEAYKKAYEVDPGNRIFIGDKLIEAYEKLGRYDEALSLVDDIIKTQPLGNYGKEQYTLTRSRLLAAKASAEA